MRPVFISGSIIILSLVVGVPLSTNAETIKMMSGASSDGLFTLAQTNGMNRRQDRRDSRQDCRQQEGGWHGQAQLQTGKTWAEI